MRIDLFAITRDADGDGKVRWRCGHCRQAIAQAADVGFELTWADIRGQRDLFLQRTDWTQLPDAPPDRQAQFAPLRQAARDLTDLVDPAAAQAALVLLLEQAGL
ncbi:phage tail assembly chaperone [Sphingomonas sp. CBMAI 2297]|uniref:phage tail assembly chaperone n=1 Tax=Sphingomonas sp. CBMAI 2297 TaxID=2991720 RepID=UPI0024547577|nr:phage tail assembly chaperone [Sphingomonas sp. CBMAI 2297]MDH4745811.1 phage tail assembly chaperone [Sphingomonas sp. CBMAI 2297]